MEKKQNSKRAKATEAFGELPREVKALGKPISVHPISKLGQFFTSARMQLWLYATATLCLLVIIGTVLMYLLGKPLGNNTPDVWLAITFVSFLAGGVFAVFGYLVRRPTVDGTDPDLIKGLIIYPDALVRVKDEEFEIMRWDEVIEIHEPASKNLWTVVDKDGKQFSLLERMEDSSMAMMNLIQCVNSFFGAQKVSRN